MFDTFAVIMPKLLPLPEVSIRQHETAFGLDNARVVYFNGVRLGCVVPAHIAFSQVKAWTGSADRGNWDVLSLHTAANAAAAHDETWAEFLAALRALLERHDQWRLTCESDCNQHPLQRLPLTAATAAELLDSYRIAGHFPIAFFVEVPEPGSSA